MTRPLSDNGLILASTILSIGSLLFVILLFVSYFSKDKLTLIRNKLYKNMLVVNLILIVSELIEVLLISYYNNPILLLIAFRIHWSTE